MKINLGAKPYLYPTVTAVVGTYKEDGTANIMTAGYAGIVCANPVCISVALRPATQSHGNILRSGAFTVNIPSEEFAREVDFVGMVSGRNTDKFAAAGLTATKSGFVNAPCVKEFPITIECQLVKSVELGSHTLFIGQVMNVEAEEAFVNEHHAPDILKVRPLCYANGNAASEYYGIGASLGRTFSCGNALKAGNEVKES